MEYDSQLLISPTYSIQYIYICPLRKRKRGRIKNLKKILRKMMMKM